MTSEHKQTPQKQLRIGDIATLAGVSVGTVSRALNNRAEIAPATRDRILRIVEQTGFVRNPAARSLVSRRVGIIEIVVSIDIDDYIGQIIRGANQALRPTEYSMLLHLQGLDEQHERLFANRLSHGTADGALLIAPKYVDPELADLRRRGFPVVVIEHRGGPPDVPSVSALHYEGARQATEYLLSLGHTRLATITGDLDEHSGKERLRGYRDALAAAGIWCRDDDIVTGDYTPASGSAAMRLLLSRPSPPTAIFAGNDLMALAALSAIKDAGLAVPQDVSLVGFDDIPISAGATPPLTTVRQPIVEMGHLAATMLLNLIEGRPVAPEPVYLPTTLVVRSSCSRPPRRAHQARTITKVT